MHELESHYNDDKVSYSHLQFLHADNAQKAIKDIAPYIVLTGLGKIASSFQRTRFRSSTTATTPARAHTDIDSGRGRITKQKRFSSFDMGKREDHARVNYEQRQHSRRAAQWEMTRSRASRANQAVKCTLQYHDLPSKQSYLSTLPALDPNQSYEERRRIFYEKLTSIVGEGRMKMGVGFPSGHSGIDPAIAEYHQQKAISDFWDRVDFRKAEERRLAEEQQRRRAQEEAERLEIEILLHHARARYMERVERLAFCGPHLDQAVNLLESALAVGNFPEAMFIAESICVDILKRADEIFRDMNKEISLGKRVPGSSWNTGQWTASTSS